MIVGEILLDALIILVMVLASRLAERKDFVRLIYAIVSLLVLLRFELLVQQRLGTVLVVRVVLVGV